MDVHNSVGNVQNYVQKGLKMPPLLEKLAQAHSDCAGYAVVIQ